MKKRRKKRTKPPVFGCLKLLGMSILLIFIFFTFLNLSKSNKDEITNTPEIPDIYSRVDSENETYFYASLQNALEKVYGITNIKFRYSDGKIFRMKNDETLAGEKLNFIMSGIGKFEYQDKIYDFNFMVNKSIEDKAATYLHLDTSFSDKIYSVPLKSEQN